MSRLPFVCRFAPNCEELTATVSGLPLLFASMLNILPLVCNELCVTSWQQLVSKNKSPQQQHPASHGHAVDATTAAVTSTHGTDTDPISSDGGQVTAKVPEQPQQGKHVRARSARLEVLLATCGAMEVQVYVC